MNDVIRAKSEAIAAAQNFSAESSVHGVPVNVFAIAREKNINVVPEPGLPDEISGFFKRYGKRDGRPVIVLNDAHSDTRKRFTLAHELGHYVLHGDPLDVVTEKIHFRISNGDPSDTNEIAANAFAAELLMPAAVVRQELSNQFPDGLPLTQIDQAATKLSSKFDVSLDAMRYRIMSLVQG